MRRILSSIAVLFLATALAACTGTTALSPGLTARLDQPGATLDRNAAIELVNQYRASRGLNAVTLDAAVTNSATIAANTYARTGEIEKGRAELGALDDRVPGDGRATEKVSAGYPSFGETFSGWRNNPNDAEALAAPWATKAGLAAVYNASSPYGTYWVIILSEG
ncbi:CAP domain-containing protein [Cucumibacter marinus]|uniref:CAP domain-containing protein n=1 Tax=Cucumibacter marinus TaxID=1121252 RepID=UPI0004004C20|nr:CAP domain-containing protein [Cucumibacter marinus]